MMGIKKQNKDSLCPIKVFHLTLISEFLLLVTFFMACPYSGQANNNQHVTKEGLFNVYQQDDKVFFELDAKLLDKAMLFVRHGMGFKQVVWTRYRDQLLLESTRIESLSGTTIPLNNEPSIEKHVLGIFPIIQEKSNSNTFYIEVTRLFVTNDISWHDGFKETMIEKVSSIENVVSLENDIVIETKRILSKDGIMTPTEVYFSFLILRNPMKPRLFDYRMGFFAEDMLSAINQVPKYAKACISRWRLEKKYPNDSLSEPISPITFFLSPDIPIKWRPYITKGILEWLPAFEAAGFKNAIQVREVPANDAQWPMFSAKYSVVRWANKTGIRGFENNSGSNVSTIIDLRSGEILKSDIIIGTSYQHLEDAYFIRCASLDIRAQHYPFPDDLLGKLIQSEVAHEAGHAFGIKDANYGEYAYPFDQMRNKEWLQKMGHTPSIMTYARHNYLVQPEDSIPPDLLIQKVGPTDVYNVVWGYKPFPNAYQPKDEWPYLEKIVLQQDSIAWYRYNIGQFDKIGPECSNEVADNNDPIKSTILGLKSMKRVLELLPEVAMNSNDNDLLERLYNETVSLWYNQMRHVMTLVGGYTIHYKSGAQKGSVFTPVKRKSQEDAMEFLLSNALNPPNWLTDPEFNAVFRYSTAKDLTTKYQLKLLSELINPLRMQRLENMETDSNYEGITANLLSRLRLSLWSELNEQRVNVSRYRQELQSAYIHLLVEAITKQKRYAVLNPNDAYYDYSDYSRSIFMSELLKVKALVTENWRKPSDTIAQGHFRLCLSAIDQVVFSPK